MEQEMVASVAQLEKEKQRLDTLKHQLEHVDEFLDRDK
jgi:hypothetical protein